jgi:hypothetical protein
VDTLYDQENIKKLELKISMESYTFAGTLARRYRIVDAKKDHKEFFIISNWF